MIPSMIMESDATNDVAPATPAAAIEEKPTATDANPVPISISPAPIPDIPMPSKVNAAPSPMTTGNNGDNTAEATPITVNAPARDTSPFIIPSHDNLLISANTPNNENNDVQATESATAPLTHPDIICILKDNANNEPVTAVSPLVMSFHFIPPNLTNADDIPTNADAITGKSIATQNVSPGINFIAATIAAKDPAIPTRPLAIPFQLRLDNSDIAQDIDFKAWPIKIRDPAVLITSSDLDDNLVNATDRPSNPAIAERPFAILCQSRDPSFFTAEHIMFRAAPIIIILDAALNTLSPNLSVVKNVCISYSNTLIAVKP